jgi:UDP-galactopyranose mutase
MYFRTKYMEDYVAGLNSSDAFVLTAKPLRALGVTFGQHEHRQNCSTSPDYMYPWGQPVVYSKAALEQVVTGFTLGSVTKQCKVFGVTHDVGNPLVHFMYMMPEVRLPPISPSVPKSWGERSNELIGVHAVGRSSSALNTTQLHEQVKDRPYPQPPYQYQWHRPTGFMTTRTYHLHGNASSWKDEWRSMPVSDCKGPVYAPGTPTKHEMLTALGEKREYDVCVVGAGLSGSVIAERYARQLDKAVLVVEKRDHVGGNCYDYIDPDTNIRVSKYGAHLFHTYSDRVWQYVQQFTEWVPYNHSVIGLVDDKYVPIPVNIATVNTLFNLNITTVEEMDVWLEKEQVHFDHEPANSEEMALSRVGPRLYDLIFKPYTIKQWNQHPADLGPEVTARIPVRNNHDGRYFGDPYQALPESGYTAMFEKMLQHDNIDVHTRMDYFSVRDELTCGKTYYSGPIDTYFADLGWDKLEYRSLHFERVVEYNVTNNFYQPAFVVNHPKEETPYTRIVEYKHLPGQADVSPHTVFFLEHSKDGGEPYYPVPNQRNKELYAKYQAMADKEKNVIFVGRLANYKYFNMDQAILNALELYDRETQGGTNRKRRKTRKLFSQYDGERYSECWMSNVLSCR